MRPLRYAINVTLDGCVDHTAGVPNPETHAHAAKTVGEADALIFGRVIYGMMEDAWRPVAKSGQAPAGSPDWILPFARSIDAAKKYVVSDTLPSVDWNADLVRGKDIEATVRRLKQQPGGYLMTGGVKLPLTLAKLGLIDEYDFTVHPRIAGRGPTLFASLPDILDLKLVSETPLAEGIVARRFVPR